jgi:hypothetical protein
MRQIDAFGLISTEEGEHVLGAAELVEDKA